MKQIFILKEPVGQINNPLDLFSKIRKIDIDYNQENFMIFGLDIKNKLICSEALFKGGLNGCLIDPKTIFRFALINNCNSIIIAHNHPSGDLNPSDEDKEIFYKLKKMGDLLQLKLLDSIVFNKKEYYSMA